MTSCAQKMGSPLWERFHRDWMRSLTRIAVEPLPQLIFSFFRIVRLRAMLSNSNFLPYF